MKRLLLDTNIYGELVFDGEYISLKDKMPQRCVIHGFDVVRKELRDVPSKVKVYGHNLRISLLHVYDEITAKSYSLTEEMSELAHQYYNTYRDLGGSKSEEQMFNDFTVVACASLHQIDIVVSEDNKSMLVENALKSYNLINEKQKIRTPEFIGYLQFKRWLNE